MDIKLRTESVVSNPTIISYGLIGLTTMVLGYFTFFDEDTDAEPNVESEPKAESEPESESNLLPKDLFGSEPEKPKTEEPTFMNQLSDIAEPVKNILEPISEQVPAALPAVGGKKTRGQRRKRRQNRSSKHRK